MEASLAEAEKPDCESSQSVEYSSLKFTWKISNFSKLSAEKLYSDIFNAGDHKWRLLIFPKGNKKEGFLSVYLDVADSKTLAYGWSRDAKFSISVISKVNEHTKESTEHKFNAGEKNWGFGTFIALNELEDPNRGYLVNDICTLIAEVSCTAKEEEMTEICKEKNSPFAEFDTLYNNIQTILEANTSESDNSNNFSAKEIADAEMIFQQCLDMGITSVIQSGKAPVFKNSLYILLTNKVFPINMVDRTTKIVAEFVQSCLQYEIAQQELSEAEENENSVVELKASLKQLSAIFMPVRYQAEAVDKEIAKLERQITEKRAKKEILGKKLKEFTDQANMSKEALVCAEQKKKSSAINRKQAENIIKDFERSWEFLKALRTTRALTLNF